MARSTHLAMLDKIRYQSGFIAALDQSGGSTPKALQLYGVAPADYQSEEDMFSKVHAMRSRIITNPAFSGDRILGAILFADTLTRTIAGQPSAAYLWQQKQIVPFLKVDQGLESESDGVQLMKPAPELASLLAQARQQDVFGTKMRALIKAANPEGINKLVAQQFAWAQQILAADLVPIIEPEVDIHCPDKAAAEALLRAQLLAQLDRLTTDQQVLLKLTLPEQLDFYRPCLEHPQVLRVVALSGGYSRDQANQRLSANPGVIASFSRALTEGLSVQQSEAAFTAMLDQSIESIYQASIT